MTDHPKTQQRLITLQMSEIDVGLTTSALDGVHAHLNHASELFGLIQELLTGGMVSDTDGKLSALCEVARIGFEAIADKKGDYAGQLATKLSVALRNSTVILDNGATQ